VATFGKTLALLACILLVGSGCSQSAGTVGTKTPTGEPTQSRAAQVTPTPGLARALCTVPTPASWQSLIQHASPRLPSGSRVIPFATGADPSVFFAEFYSSTWSGVVSISVSSSEIRRIAVFADPQNDQAYAGGFDGRWLVWIEQLSLDDSNDWQILAWDSATNQAFQVQAAPRANGATVSGPIVEPVVSNGKAAWVQANTAGVGEVHEFSLASRQDQVVGSQATTPLLFWGSDLVWMHLDVPGQSGHLEMLDTRSGLPLSVPKPLASVTHLAFLAVSDNLVAWTDGKSIWAYRPGQDSASLVNAIPQDSANFLGIAGDLITWDGSSDPYALDMRSSSVTKLTPKYGGRFASGNSLLIYWPVSDTKTASGQFVVADVDASNLPPLPSCSA